MNYRIQQRIETLNENAIFEQNAQPKFELDEISFSQWEFNHRDGWLIDAWIAETNIESDNVFNALKSFGEKIDRIVPRIAFVGQAYTEVYHQPALAIRDSSDIAYFYHPFDSEPVGLMFMQEELQALRQIMTSPIPDEFFKYWNDAVNTLGYAPKLLILFSAIEAFAKKQNGGKDWKLIEGILGTELKNKIFEPRVGLRHRLAHGEYFTVSDSEDNYVELIHRSFMKYFNDQIFHNSLLATNVVHPFRHLFGNKSVGRYFIKSVNKDSPLELKEVLADFNSNSDHKPSLYDYVFDDSTKGY